MKKVDSRSQITIRLERSRIDQGASLLCRHQLEQTTVHFPLIRDKKPPYIPEVNNIWDTQNFDPYEEEEPWIPPEGKAKGRKKNPEFIGYTYKPVE